MTKINSHNNYFSMQKIMLGKIKDFSKKSVTMLYLMVDTVDFMAAEIFLLYDQFSFKWQSTLFSNLSTVFMIYNLPKIGLTYCFWGKNVAKCVVSYDIRAGYFLFLSELKWLQSLGTFWIFSKSVCAFNKVLRFDKNT